MSNSTQWHKHRDGTWHRTTGRRCELLPEFKYEQLGVPYIMRGSMIVSEQFPEWAYERDDVVNYGQPDCRCWLCRQNAKDVSKGSVCPIIGSIETLEAIHSE